ncbi:outer membrane protein [Falsirhodobacter deserti]|uniref:outer membrane protein n=1 Tax=Falsirhodobacter deserti TaxID=1365611 RepID=UPI000FE37AC4|nr:outer membrane beta-barrel protein [Falsirhodobacter deserti]
MMNRIAAAGFGLVALAATPVLAGGPVVPTPEPVVASPAVVVPAAPSFQGGYVGGGLGYAFAGDDRVGAIPVTRDAGTLEISGAVGNVHTGYRWQQPGSRIVYGVEAMATLADVGDDADEAGFRSANDLKWTATLRGNLGYVVQPDMLLYGFAGYSVGRSEYWVVGNGDVLHEERDLDGYVVGLGLEKLLNNNWSVRGEYEYANYGSETTTSNAGTFTTEETPEFHTLRVGLNYRF